MNHEIAYRGKELIKKFQTTRIFICGAGALGGNLAENLARLGFESLAVVDFDTVSDTNLATQPYGKPDLGKSKVLSLANRFYRDLGIKCKTYNTKLTELNVYGIKDFNSDIVVDCFDNSASRKLVYDFTTKTNIPCLHGGMSSNFGEVKWNSSYLVPRPSKQEDVCDYPLTRSLINLTVTGLVESLIKYIDSGKQVNYHINVDKMEILEVK